MQTKLPETVTATLYIHASKICIGGKYSVSVFGCDMSDTFKDIFLVGTQEVTLNVPQIDFIQAQVDCLNKQKNQISAKTQVALKSIDDQIQSLTCIEHK